MSHTTAHSTVVARPAAPADVARSGVSRSARAEVVVLALPAVLGTVALLLVARKGVYASPDSAFYVGTARNLLDGEGLTAPPGSPPLSHFPPLFALVLGRGGMADGTRSPRRGRRSSILCSWG